MKRLECLDGLRGVLAVYVMLSHMAPFAVLPRWLASALSHGGGAVDVFFVLSGLVIVRSLEGFGYRARPFLTARAMRIFPVFLAMFALAVAVQPIPSGFAAMPWIAADSPAREIWSQGWPHHWVAEIAAHLTMTHGMLPDGMLPGAWVSFLGAAWSLSTEWQFYVLALLLGRRFGGSVWPFLVLAAAGAVWAEATPESWHFSRAFLPNKAGYFALGVASAGLVRACGASVRQERSPSPCGPRPQGEGERYLIVLFTVMLWSFHQGGAAKVLPPVVWTLCLTAEICPALPLVAAVLRSRLAQWLGALSYSLYLANEPVQKLLGTALTTLVDGDGRWFTVFWLPGSVGLPLLAAVLLRKWIEMPALAWLRRQPVHLVARRLDRGQ